MTAPLAPPPPPSEGTRSSTPALAPGVELLGELSGSGYRDAPSLVRRPDGQTLQVTPLLYALLTVVDGQRDSAGLASALGERLDRAVTAGDVDQLLDKLETLGVLDDPTGSAPPPAVSNPLLALRFKFVVSDPRVTSRITTPFAQLFRTWVVVPVLVLFAFVTWWVLAEQGLGSAARNALYEPHLLLAVVALTIVSAGFHEFGHAAACRYGGVQPGAMGAGLYLVWPAFYTDVGDCYRLSRWGRLRVDLGGLYFNAVFAVAVAGLWLLVREDALLLGVAAQLVQMVRQLAPFVRADGYHILADLTGVPDLFSHLGPTLKGMLPWRWGRSSPTPLKRWARVVVSAWVVVVAPLLVGLLVLTVLLLPRLLATAWDSLDSQGGSLASDLGSGDVVGALARLLSLVGLVLPAAAAVYLVVRVGRRALARLRSATDGRPVARAVTSALVALLLALVAWAWWPAGQYEPVRADERGTLGSLLDTRSSNEPTLVTQRAASRSAIALVPRSGDGPVVLLVRPTPDAPVQAVVTSRDGGTARTFPFQLPAGPRPGDNQAVALGTQDGGVVYDIAFAMVTVTDGGVVDTRNEAFALASCTGCTTVAVAFQVVLVVGQTDAVAPVNTAVAANAACLQCVTTALATQLVVTLSELPSEEVQRLLEQAWSQLDGLEDAGLSVEELYVAVQAVQQEVLDVLVDSGLVDTSAAGAVTTTKTAASASPAPSGAASAGPASPRPSATTATTASPAPSAAPSPAAASPAPTSSPRPTATTSP